MESEIINTEYGCIEVIYKDFVIHELKFVADCEETNKNELIRFAVNDYFNNKNKEILLPFKVEGTEFQKKVWDELCKIPYGYTRTYRDIALSIGQPNASRAVANACGQNKLAILIPCHRVVGGKDNGGFKYGVHIKEWLLDLEKS